MVFPVIPTAAASTLQLNWEADTNATRNFGGTSGLDIVNGDLLIAVIACYQTGTGTDAAFSGWTNGFTEIHDTATSLTLAMGAAYKWADGAESSPAVTQAGTITGHAAEALMIIKGAHRTTPPEAGSRATNTGSAADPVSFNPGGWDVEDTLWIAVCGIGETSTTGSFNGVTAAPTNFTDFAATGITSDAVGGMQLAVAFRQNAVSAEDVGGFTLDTSNARNGAFVIAVRPAPVPILPLLYTPTIVAP